MSCQKRERTPELMDEFGPWAKSDVGEPVSDEKVLYVFWKDNPRLAGWLKTEEEKSK